MVKNRIGGSPSKHKIAKGVIDPDTKKGQPNTPKRLANIKNALVDSMNIEQRSIQKLDKMDYKTFVDRAKKIMDAKAQEFAKYKNSKLAQALEIITFPWSLAAVVVFTWAGLVLSHGNDLIGDILRAIIVLIVTIVTGTLAFIFSIPLLIHNYATINNTNKADIEYRAGELFNNILAGIKNNPDIDYNDFISQLDKKRNSKDLINKARFLLKEMYNSIDFIYKIEAFSKKICDAEEELKQLEQEQKKQEKSEKQEISTTTEISAKQKKKQKALDKISNKKQKIEKLKAEEENRKNENLKKVTNLTKNLFDTLFDSFESEIEDENIKKEFIKAKQEYFTKGLEDKTFGSNLLKSFLHFTAVNESGSTSLKTSKASQVFKKTYYNKYVNITFHLIEPGYSKRSAKIFEGDMATAITNGIKQSVLVK